MKKYNTYLASLLLLFTTLGTQSCLNDTNEWAESFKDTLLGMGTVQTLDEDDYYFLLDEGSKLYPRSRSISCQSAQRWPKEKGNFFF